MAARSALADLVYQLSVERANHKRIAVRLRLGLGSLNQGLGVGHG